MSPARWVWCAALTGFASAFTFSSWLHWPRDWFVLGYTVAVGLLLIAFVRGTGFRPVLQLQRRWPAGVLGGLAFGAILARGVASQPPSARPEGPAIVQALLWLGIVYGGADALLLSVVPVAVVYGTRGIEEMRDSRARMRWAGVALLASLGVAAAYHLGFAEFRGPSLAGPLIGNGIITLSYLLTGSPVAPILAHVIMHAAAVFHGMETTAQLPPHY
jgi:hypothetical protein